MLLLHDFRHVVMQCLLVVFMLDSNIREQTKPGYQEPERNQEFEKSLNQEPKRNQEDKISTNQ